MYREVTRRLIALGHRRIVLLCPRSWRQPGPGLVVQTFTAELAAHGIASSEFNVPDYEPTTAGLHTLLESLFRITPPTALIVEDPDAGTATYLFLARRGLAVPDDVSLFIPWRDPSLQSSHPPVAHLDCNVRLLVQHIVRWVRAVARGRVNRDTKVLPATLVPGGTLGPARK